MRGVFQATYINTLVFGVSLSLSPTQPPRFVCLPAWLRWLARQVCIAESRIDRPHLPRRRMLVRAPGRARSRQMTAIATSMGPTPTPKGMERRGLVVSQVLALLAPARGDLADLPPPLSRRSRPHRSRRQRTITLLVLKRKGKGGCVERSVPLSRMRLPTAVNGRARKGKSRKASYLRRTDSLAAWHTLSLPFRDMHAFGVELDRECQGNN